ncbi:MAG TPA: ABC transporter permease [Candidatus Izemoplasmatales bacterium]|nr:ABC transporter permease [Candidatus Izemoplasmatales bacterium]
MIISELIYNLTHSTFETMIPLLIVAVGAMICEKSGVTNIALEGIMIIGAFVGVWFVKAVEPQTLILAAQQTNLQKSFLFLQGAFIGGIAGMLFSWLHAYASISMKADQTISATALNLIAPALAVFIARSVFGGKQIAFKTSFKMQEVGSLANIPVIGDLFFKSVNVGLYVGIVVLLIAWIFLYKTKTGLRLMACGENPHAADSLGVNIFRVRYGAVLASGFLGGMGGFIFAVSAGKEFDGTVLGYGFLAIAVLIFGNWKPFRVLFAAFFFGLMKTISASYSAIPFLNDMEISPHLYKMIPYVATLIVLVASSKASHAPKAAGKIYDKGTR